MAGGTQGTGQGWLGDRGILDSNAEFNCTVGGQRKHHLPSQRKGAPPQGDPMSTLIFSTVMTETVNTALQQLTSKVQALSYVAHRPGRRRQ